MRLEHAISLGLLWTVGKNLKNAKSQSETLELPIGGIKSPRLKKRGNATFFAFSKRWRALSGADSPLPWLISPRDLPSVSLASEYDGGSTAPFPDALNLLSGM